MKQIVKINSITELHDYFGLPKPKHPLVSVLRVNDYLDEQKLENLSKFKYTMGLYQISLKDTCPFTITNYGCNSYDFQEGTMLFLAPNQVIEFERQNYNKTETGWSILFHPDLIRKSELGKNIKQYSFFSYASNEALHLSDDERNTVTEISQKIQKEYQNNIDAHSQTLIVSNIELLLNYCTRFYDRQFYTRTNLNKDIVAQFEQLLISYYASAKPLDLGIPTVQFCGAALNLSAKYLSDLLRKETGHSAKDHINEYVIEQAKNKLIGSQESVSEIAYGLGFEYPQYFSKMFKKQTGFSPAKYRALN